MVPQPVVAVLFLFPVTKESEAAKEAGIPIGSPTHLLRRNLKALAHLFVRTLRSCMYVFAKVLFCKAHLSTYSDSE